MLSDADAVEVWQATLTFKLGKRTPVYIFKRFRCHYLDFSLMLISVVTWI